MFYPIGLRIEGVKENLRSIARVGAAVGSPHSCMSTVSPVCVCRMPCRHPVRRSARL